MRANHKQPFCAPAVRQRHLDSSGGGQCRSDAGYNLDLNAGPLQGIQFLSCTPKNQGITTLQPDDDFSVRGEPQHQLADRFLGYALSPAAFPNIHNPCA
jgi:hypothetical protein